MSVTSAEEMPQDEAWATVAVDVLQVVAEVLDRLDPDTREQITRAVGLQAPDYLDHEGLLSRVQTAMDAINYNN